MRKSVSYLHFSNYSFFTDSVALNKDNSHIYWFYEGYIITRNSEKNQNYRHNYNHVFDTFYEKYADQFIHHFKGNFTLIQMYQNKFKLYSDRFGIEKYFYWNNGKDFIISNDLKQITSKVDVRPSCENMAIYALTYHSTGGRTIFSEVLHNIPGQILEFKNDKLSKLHYWKPSQLLYMPSEEVSIKEISSTLTCTLESSLCTIDKNHISLSLTGGADTRNLLAMFLKMGIQPHLYTYGNVASDDVLKARAISKGLRLAHSVYDINLDETTFEAYARKIIRSSGGLASIHRAHRLMAVECEKEFADTMYLGTLGGEFIKGVSEDDYIIPSVVYNNWSSILKSDIVLRYFIEKHLNTQNSLVIDSVTSFLEEQPFTSGSIIERKHSSLCDITAHLHDAQDVNLYKTVMNNVITPFLDIDYLELIFSSQHCYTSKEIIKNKYLKKVNFPVYSSQFLKETYPPLLKFRYSREHRPDEVLYNKYYAAFMRFIRQKAINHYPPNFPLGAWMEKFVARNLEKCKDYDIIYSTFNIDSLLSEFNNNTHLQTESYWLKFTNPIMMRFILDEFKK